MLTRKAYNSHLTSTGNRTEDVSLKAAARFIGCDRRWAYKMARRGILEVTRKANAAGVPMIFVSKRSVFAKARAFNA